MMGGEDDEDVKLSAEEEKSRDAARPALVAVLSNLSLVYAKSGDHGAALEKAAGALALDEGCAKARYRRAEAFAATGRYEEALEDMRKVAESQPDAPLYQKKCEEIKRRKVAADKKVDMFYRQMFDGVKRV